MSDREKTNEPSEEEIKSDDDLSEEDIKIKNKKHVERAFWKIKESGALDSAYNQFARDLTSDPEAILPDDDKTALDYYLCQVAASYQLVFDKLAEQMQDPDSAAELVSKLKNVNKDWPVDFAANVSGLPRDAVDEVLKDLDRKSTKNDIDD